MSEKPGPMRMRSLLVGPLLARVRAAGKEPGELIRRFGLPIDAERAPSVILTLATLGELFDAAASMLGDPFVGVHVAEHVARGTFGVVEFSCEAATTARDAFHRLSRYHALLNDLVVVSVRDEGGLVAVEQSIPGAPLCVGRHANEFFVANLLLQSRRVTTRPFIPRSARFAHPRPTNTSELERVLGTRSIQFDAGRNGALLDPLDVDSPMTTADPPLASVLDSHAEELLRSRPKPIRFVDQVRREVEPLLATGTPSLEAIAAALRLAPRTLQRRLGDDGTNLSEIIEALREELARARVLDPGRTNDVLASELGYADTRAFLRAFKRWTHLTPGQYRAERAR